jgi:hypothetical protein
MDAYANRELHVFYDADAVRTSTMHLLRESSAISAWHCVAMALKQTSFDHRSQREVKIPSKGRQTNGAVDIIS